MNNTKKLLLLLTTVFLICIVLAVILFSGKTAAQGDCYTRETICIGYESDNCIGLEFDRLEIDSEDKCDKSDEIINRCEQFGESLCEDGQTDWRDSAEVSGLKCSQWSQKYNIGEIC